VIQPLYAWLVFLERMAGSWIRSRPRDGDIMALESML